MNGTKQPSPKSSKYPSSNDATEPTPASSNATSPNITASNNPPTTSNATQTHPRSTSSTFRPNLVALHHIKPWSEGGKTDLANLVLLCRKHHTLHHESEWTVRMATDGLPEFIPPQWIDPLQRPRRNLIHRLQI